MPRYRPTGAGEEIKLDGQVNVFEDDHHFVELSVAQGFLPDVMRVSGQIHSFTLHPDNDRFSFSAGNSLYHVDRQGKLLSSHRITSHAIDKLCWSADGERIYALALEFESQRKGVITIDPEGNVRGQWLVDEEDDYLLDLAASSVDGERIAVVGHLGVRVLDETLTTVSHHTATF